MSDASSDQAQTTEGVLANLPRIRPHRSSPRREDARRTATAKTTPTQAPKRKRTTVKKKRQALPKNTAKRTQNPAPRQGFESESDRPVSGPVQPPGGVELLASAAALAGELTKTGLATGGRLLKDFLTRLPLN